jgi:hypothetical protein
MYRLETALSTVWLNDFLVCGGEGELRKGTSKMDKVGSLQISAYFFI